MSFSNLHPDFKLVFLLVVAAVFLKAGSSGVGDVVGDGVRLRWDFGRYSWDLTPEDESEHEYAVSYEYMTASRQSCCCR